MRMKSYFAGSVQTAMEDARRELGDEAILVTSRLAPAEAGKARQYEVVFATEAPEKPAPRQAAPPTVKFPAHSTVRAYRETPVTSASLEAVLNEIREIRQQIQALLPQAGGLPRTETGPAREFLAHLLNADVDPDLAQQLVASAMHRLSNTAPASAEGGSARFADALRHAANKLEKPDDFRSALTASIRDVFRVGTGFEDVNQGSVVLAMIGPPGAGKTAAIARVAVRYGLRERKPTLLISADNLRIAAGEQLRGYAAVLGLRFEVAQSSRALQQLLDDHRSYGLILIDTPGFSSSDWSEGTELAHFLAGSTGIQKHLVLPAPARCSDMNRICSAYEVFRPTHLIFSRMDETTMFGPALSEAMGSGLPVSFFATGPRVPEDILEANADVIADRLLPVQTTPLTMPAAA